MHDSDEIGLIDVDIARRRLTVEGREVPIGARAFDLLIAFVARQGRVATKGELLDAVWPDSAVEEHNLVVQVRNLRKVLGASARIMTIPGRGYQFVVTSGKSSTEIGLGTTTSGDNLNRFLPTTLPAALGRDEDLEIAGALLAQCRLVTLTGIGGIGKTFLARRLLHDKASDFAHGQCWIELGTLSDLDQIVFAVAGRFGVDASGSTTVVLGRLSRTLSGKQVLLGFDNAEHLLCDVGHVVTALLAEAPELRIVVTSQVPLRVEGEQTFHVEPLTVPPPAEYIDAATAKSYAAVALFCARAVAADHRFKMTDANAASVIDVCRRLEGIPLAIEMAAARASSLGVAALASLMGQQLDILVADRPGLPQRQRTLRATLEWSHRLLRPLEKVVLRRLGVFAGGFSLDLMLDVVPAATEETERWAVLDAFASLVDRSLVWVDPGNPPRYRLLESINAFALERLAEAGETAALFARHALTMRKVYAAIFATRMQHFDNAMSLLKRDLDNARTALRWALENDPETALVLAAPLRSVDEAMSLSNAPIWSQTEALMSPAVPVAIRADWTLAACKRRQGDIGYSARMADEAVRLFREAGDPSGVQEALFQAVGARLVLGDAAGHARALAEFRSLDGVARPPGIRWRRLSVEGMVLMGMGRAEEALAIYDRTLEIIPSAGDQYAEWLLRFGIIDAELASGKIERAVAHADALVSQERSGGSQLRLVLSLLSFSSALLERGDCARARSVLVEAWPMCVIYDLQLYASEQLALLAALEGRAHACACLIGHADATRSAQPGVRDSTEQRAMARASNLARALIGPAAFDKVLSQGVVLVDAAIASIGFDEGEAT